MKRHRSTEDAERLSRLLHEWQPDASLPPRFQEQVWHRITRWERSGPPGLWAGFARWAEAAFSRPAVAVAYLALLLCLGLGSGYWQAQSKSQRAEARWRQLYVQSVDPYQAPRSEP